MSASTSKWVARIIYMGLGFLAGILFHVFLQEKNLPIQNNATLTLEDVDDRFLIVAEKQKAMLREVVRNEIAMQFSLLNAEKTNLYSNEKTGDSKNNPANNPQNVAVFYESADRVLTNVISSGGFTADSASDFLNHLHKLPINQQLELRAKQLDSFNQGLIGSYLSPEEVIAQNK
jgi:hypothetical protein